MPRTAKTESQVTVAIDGDLSKKNAEQFKKIKKVEEYNVRTNNKTKVIERTSYENGVVKERVVAILKGDKVIFDSRNKK